MENSVAKNNLTPDVYTRHPLENTWSLWYLQYDFRKSWKDMLHKVKSFNTVEGFWSLFHHINPPSDIPYFDGYSLFKAGILPMWEDPANRDGGRWIITLDKGPEVDLNKLWLDVLLSLISESFQHSVQICGAIINVRSNRFRISVWTADGENTEAVLEIGKKLKELLLLGDNQLQYQLFRSIVMP